MALDPLLPLDDEIPTFVAAAVTFMIPAPTTTPTGAILPSGGSSDGATDSYLTATADDLSVGLQGVMAAATDLGNSLLDAPSTLANGLLTLSGDPSQPPTIGQLQAVGAATDGVVTTKKTLMGTTQVINVASSIASIANKATGVIQQVTNVTGILQGALSPTNQIAKEYDRLNVWVKGHSPAFIQKAGKMAAQLGEQLTAAMQAVDEACNAIMGTIGQIQGLIQAYSDLLSLLGGLPIGLLLPPGFPYATLNALLGISSLDLTALSACAGIIQLPPVPILTP